MSKIDVADAFYRINLNPVDSIHMGVLFHSKKGERKLIGFPLVLPMGWAESPPAFCAGTKTIADLANATLATKMQSLDVPHCLDAVSETVPTKISETVADLKIGAKTGIQSQMLRSEIPNLVLVSRTDSVPHLMSKGALKTDLDFPSTPKNIFRPSIRVSPS